MTLHLEHNTVLFLNEKRLQLNRTPHKPAWAKYDNFLVNFFLNSRQNVKRLLNLTVWSKLDNFSYGLVVEQSKNDQNCLDVGKFRLC